MHMSIKNVPFFAAYCQMANDGWLQNWHERNGGNLSYRIKHDEVELIKAEFSFNRPWQPIQTTVKGLAGEFFLVTGSGKYFRHVLEAPEDSLGIIEISSDGVFYRVVWGYVNGGRPTSELPTHLLNHETKKEVSEGNHRLVYHAHLTNVIALTYVLPLESSVFTKELWESATECPVVFPNGIGVLNWMVPGSETIGKATSELIKTYDAVVWAHHGVFVTGESFDDTFGLMHTIEKSAEILVKVKSMAVEKRQTITKDEFLELANAFGIELAEL